MCHPDPRQGRTCCQLLHVLSEGSRKPADSSSNFPRWGDPYIIIDYKGIIQTQPFGPTRTGLTGHFSSRTCCRVGWCQAFQIACFHSAQSYLFFSLLEHWSPGCTLVNILHSKFWLGNQTNMLKCIYKSFYLVLAILLQNILWLLFWLYFQQEDKLQEIQHIIDAQ